MFDDWFETFGAEPDYITPYSAIESLRRSPEVVASVQIRPTLGSYLGTALEQEFDVPEINAVPPCGIAQTDRWFRALGKLLYKEDEAERLIATKQMECLPKIEALREKLREKIVYIMASAAHGHALLSLLGKLGMRAKGVATFRHDSIYNSENKRSNLPVNRMKEYGDAPNFNICNKQELELVNILSRLQPDVPPTRHDGMTLWGVKLGVSSLLVGSGYFGIGHERIVCYSE